MTVAVFSGDELSNGDEPHRNIILTQESHLAAGTLPGSIYWSKDRGLGRWQMALQWGTQSGLVGRMGYVFFVHVDHSCRYETVHTH
jgi:hypothetical protein